MYDCSGKQHIPFLTLLTQRKSRKSVVYQRVCAICTFALTHSRIPTAKTYHFVTMYYSHPRRLARSSIAKQNLSHRANVICDGSPSRIRRVRRISLGITTRPRSSDCVNQVQKIFVRLRKALKYKDSSAFGAFTPVLLIESF